MERPTLEPALRWERWGIILKLAKLAKEGILIDILREAPPDKVTLLLDPTHEEDKDNSTAQSKGDGRIHNEQLKMQGSTNSQKIEAVGNLCGGKPWKLCDNKAVSTT